MKIKILLIVAFVVLGIGIGFMFFTGEQADNNEYDTYIATARAKAEADIPFISVQNFKKAFAMKNEDEELYKEYVVQAEKLGDDFYLEAVERYLASFPTSPTAYELMCQFSYDNAEYAKVREYATEAREKGIATDKVKDLYIECAYMYRYIGSEYDEATPFLGERARVKMEDKYGYVDLGGKYCIYPDYEGASFILEDSTAVCKDGDWHMINTDEYVVARTNKPVDSLNFASGGRVLFSLDGKYDYMTMALTVPEEIRFDDATNFKNGVAAVKKGDKWALINTDMEFITEYVFDDVLRDDFNTCVNAGVIFVKNNGKYYMCNTEGAKISEQGFDDAKPFASSEPAAVCIGNLWGFADTTGNIVVEPKYEDARSYCIGLAAVKIDEKWVYVNSEQVVRVEGEFEDCASFTGLGVAAVKENDKWKYIKLRSYE